MTDAEARNLLWMYLGRLAAIEGSTDDLRALDQADKISQELEGHATEMLEAIDTSIRKYIVSTDSPEANAIANLYATVLLMPILKNAADRKAKDDEKDLFMRLLNRGDRK